MHETLLDHVKLHVDEITPAKKSIILKGWCASDVVDITKIRLYANKNFLFDGEFGEERKDVYGHYKKNEKFLNSGFSIPVPKKLKQKKDDIFLQILHKNKWKNVLLLDNQLAARFKEMESSFEINKDLDTNLIVVDDFYKDPKLVREFALSRNSYRPHLEFHKGERTEDNFRPDEVKEALSKLLQKKITNWAEHGANGVFQFCTSEDQVVYHVDSQSYAAVVFLTPDAPPESGTTFFRSRANGLREEPSDKEGERQGKSVKEIARLKQQIFSRGFYDKTQFDVVDVVGNVFNRLVVWDAKLIHAASQYFGGDRYNSRLFHMFFFDVEEQ